MIDPAQFAIRARVALCSRWPELERYNQTEFLRILGDILAAAGEIAADQNTVKAEKERNKVPPRQEDVAAYLEEINYPLAPGEFIDFYQMRGWKLGNGLPMKDWQSACRNWKRNNWGHPRQGTAPAVATIARPLGEWERGKKMERLTILRRELRELTHPGGSAYSVLLFGEKLEAAKKLDAQINALKRELEG